MESDNTATLILFVFGLPLRYELIHRPDASQMDSLELFGQPEFYLWDNVAKCCKSVNCRFIVVEGFASPSDPRGFIVGVLGSGQHTLAN